MWIQWCNNSLIIIITLYIIHNYYIILNIVIITIVLLWNHLLSSHPLSSASLLLIGLTRICFLRSSVVRRENPPGRTESCGASNPKLRRQTMMMRGNLQWPMTALTSSPSWSVRTNTPVTWAMELATTSLSLQPSAWRWEQSDWCACWV